MATVMEVKKNKGHGWTGTPGAGSSSAFPVLGMGLKQGLTRTLGTRYSPSMNPMSTTTTTTITAGEAVGTVVAA